MLKHPIVDNEKYSTQNYLELITGYCFMYPTTNISDKKWILSVAKQYDKKVRYFKFKDIYKAMEQNVRVVLVECLDENGYPELFWFEVPKGV